MQVTFSSLGGNDDYWRAVDNAILNEYLPDSDHDQQIVDHKVATGQRVKVYQDRVRVEAWGFKDGHSLLNPEGGAKMMKYQDFSMPRRLSAPPTLATSSGR